MPIRLLFLLALAWAVICLGLATGCSTVTRIPTPGGGAIVHVAAVGEGALASDCSGAGEWPSVESAATPEQALELSPEQLEELRFGQYVDGACLVARGSSISKELHDLGRVYLWSRGISAAGSALRDLIGLGELDIATEAAGAAGGP